MIFSNSEPPQYMVVSLTDRELKDRFVYRNKYLTIKTSIQTAFLKNVHVCFLLSICNLKSSLNVMISIPYPNSINLLFPAKLILKIEI
jgi:hypothetical protein